MSKKKICLIVLWGLISGCEYHVHDDYIDPPYTTYEYIEYYDTCEPNYLPLPKYDYCSEITYGQCSCVVFIDYDFECRQEYCFSWDICAWELYDAWCW